MFTSRNSPSLVAYVAIASLAVFNRFKTVETAAGNKYRLSPHVKPLNYRLFLQPDLSANTLTGRVIATIAISKPVASIELNAKDVNISGSPSLSGRPTVNVTYDRDAQTVTLTLAERVPPGIWELYVSFKSRISTALSGVFRISLQPGSLAQSEMYIATHFEPTDARTAFPCWDEPAMKATFDLTLTVSADKLALSNTHVVSRKLLSSFRNGSGIFEIQFARTPPMSTYLLAFVIGRFDRPLETVDANGVRIRVYAPVGRRSEGSFSIEIANRTLPHFVNLFGAQYPLAKIDLVSLPDFPSIAMENWGLILFHEPSLLVSNDTPESNRAFVAVTVVHELAHQWFGNLVSPAWWSDLWLNEGFATWLSYHSLDDIFPGYDSLNWFVRSEKLGTMRDDALEASHPVEAVVQRPEDTAEVFDSISYGKGAALVAMLHDWLGHDSFFAGLRNYIDKHRFGNADTSDLWKALQEKASNRNVGEPSIEEVMQDWTSRKGFPVIYVSVHRKEDDDSFSDCVLRLRQSRYRLPGADRFHDRWLWHIPVVIETQDGEIIRRVMTTSRLTLQLPDCGWVMLNPNATGYYRTAYHRSLMSDLLRQAARGGIGPAGRLTLLDDAFAMHAADRVWTEEPLHTVHTLRQDSSLHVWVNMLNHLYQLGAAVPSSDRRTCNNWQRYVHGLCSARLRTVSSAQLQTELTKCLNYADDDTVAKWAVRMFPLWLNGTRPEGVAPDMWSVACVIAADSDIGVTNFWQLLSTLNRTVAVERRESIIGCLGAFGKKHRPEVESRLIALALGTELHATEVLSLVDGFNSELVWRLLTQHWDVIALRFQGPYMLKRLIDGLTFRSASGARRIRQFFSSHSAVGVRDAGRRQAERVALTAQRIGKDRVEMRFLANRVLGIRNGWRRIGWD